MIIRNWVFSPMIALSMLACGERPTNPGCDPTLICGQAVTCVGGQQYPTTCGPRNCDAPLGPCERELLSATTASAEESAVCGLAKIFEKRDEQAERDCAMEPVQRSCKATVAPQMFRGSSISCRSELTGVLQGLCRAADPLPKEVVIDCVGEEGATWQHTLDTKRGEIH
jgi:hypothetical protein